MFFFLLFLLVALVVAGAVEEDWSLLVLFCASTDDVNPKSTNSGAAKTIILARGHFISILPLAPEFRR